MRPVPFGVKLLAIIPIVILAATSVTVYFRHTDAFRCASTFISNSAALRERLGSPIRDGWSVSGSLQQSLDEGTAHFEVPVAGPRASGHLLIDLRKSSGVWSVTSCYLRIGESKEPIKVGGPI